MQLFCMFCFICPLLVILLNYILQKIELLFKPAKGIMLMKNPFCVRYNYMKTYEPSETVHLAVVACGERLEETVTMLRSAIIFSIKPLQFHIFAEDQLHESFRDIVSTQNIYLINVQLE